MSIRRILEKMTKVMTATADTPLAEPVELWMPDSDDIQESAPPVPPAPDARVRLRLFNVDSEGNEVA